MRSEQWSGDHIQHHHMQHHQYVMQHHQYVTQQYRVHHHQQKQATSPCSVKHQPVCTSAHDLSADMSHKAGERSEKGTPEELLVWTAWEHAT